MVRGWRDAPLADQDRALCDYAAKLTHDQNAMSPEDLGHLRSVGFDDRAIHDATQIVGYFNYITRIADGLGIDPETFILPWGSE